MLGVVLKDSSALPRILLTENGMFGCILRCCCYSCPSLHAMWPNIIQIEQQWPVVVKGWVRLHKRLRFAHAVIF